MKRITLGIVTGIALIFCGILLQNGMPIGGVSGVSEDAEPIGNGNNATPETATTSVATEIDEYMNARTAMHQFSGSVLVARDGEIVISKGYGMADYENNISATPDTVYQIGSVTKVFTAIAILQLEEDGLLTITDPIDSYIPDYPRGDEIRIYHLLNHTSGIPRQSGVSPDAPEIQTTREIIAGFQDLPLEFTPGKETLYSNNGYYVLSYIIENVSGMSYAAYVDEHIIQPAGMSATGQDDQRVAVAGHATGYTYENGNISPAPAINVYNLYGSGSLYSTAEDLYLWDQALHDGTLITGQSLTEMVDNRYGIEDGPAGNHTSVAKSGRTSGFISQYTRHTDDNVTIIVLANLGTIPLKQIESDLEAIVFGEPYTVPEVIHRTVIEVNPGVYDAYAGVYQFDIDASMTATIFQEEESLFYQEAGDPVTVELFPEAPDRFFISPDAEDTISFTRGDDNQVTGLVVTVYGGMNFTAEKIS